MNTGKKIRLRGVAGLCALVLVGGLTLTGCNMPGSEEDDQESTEQQNRDDNQRDGEDDDSRNNDEDDD